MCVIEVLKSLVLGRLRYAHECESPLRQLDDTICHQRKPIM